MLVFKGGHIYRHCLIPVRLRTRKYLAALLSKNPNNKYLTMAMNFPSAIKGDRTMRAGIPDPIQQLTVCRRYFSM